MEHPTVLCVVRCIGGVQWEWIGGRLARWVNGLQDLLPALTVEPCGVNPSKFGVFASLPFLLGISPPGNVAYSEQLPA
eukprot:11768365-Prorocentrum_lima.AAC.1